MSPVVLVPLGAFATVLVGMLAVRSWWQARLLASPDTAPDAAPVVVPAPVEGGWWEIIGQIARPSDPAGEAEQQQWLVQAGIRAGGMYPLWLASRVVGAVVLGLLAWNLAANTLSPLLAAGVTVVGVAAGYYGPLAGLLFLRGRRQRRIRRAVPNLLDMLVSCVEAGLGVDAAIQHVAHEIGVTSPELAAEFDLLTAQLSAGVPRSTALEELGERTGVDDLGSLVHVIGVVDRMGSGIARSLRAHAQLMRRRRSLQAEERAARASPKLTVAMIVFIMPPLFVVLLGGAIVRLVEWVLPSMHLGTM